MNLVYLKTAGKGFLGKTAERGISGGKIVKKE